MKKLIGFGKHYSSMYNGSMVGKGAEVFAVMGYVIANMTPTGLEVDGGKMAVELNPKLLAFIIGEPEAEIATAIELLCSPDAESRSKEHDGRRLLRLGQFEYEVVNGWKYRDREVRDPTKRREQNRASQRRYRAKNKSGPQKGEASFLRAEAAGASQDELDRLSDPGI